MMLSICVLSKTDLNAAAWSLYQLFQLVFPGDYRSMDSELTVEDSPQAWCSLTENNTLLNGHPERIMRVKKVTKQGPKLNFFKVTFGEPLIIEWWQDINVWLRKKKL